MDIISEIGHGDNTFHLTNSLYGLFDGYLYDELVQYADEVTMSRDLYRRILGVFSVVSKYPKLQYISGVLYDVDEADVEALEYYEGMGVAEGKRYLATI
jgi:hypothetical protein